MIETILTGLMIMILNPVTVTIVLVLCVFRIWQFHHYYWETRYTSTYVGVALAYFFSVGAILWLAYILGSAFGGGN